jgi:hypothetical protein
MFASAGIIIRTEVVVDSETGLPAGLLLAMLGPGTAKSD